jgi:hypothetical protein
MTFTKEQLDKMVWDADIAHRAIIGEGVLADVCCHVKALAAELQAIMERLPKTEDGVPICPNDTVYWIGEDGFAHKWIPYIATDGRTWYRTREAAEKARTP